MALSLSNLNVTGTTYLDFRVSADPTARANGQVNLWDDNSGGPADQGAGSILEGSAIESGLTGIGTIIRIGRWSNSNRFILNSSSDGLGNAFTGTTNKVTIVHESSSGTITVVTFDQRRSGGGTWVDWWENNGLTSAEWDLIESIADGDEFILVFHTGDATYTLPATAPGVPTNVVTSNAQTNGFDVSWDAPADNGGEAITSYSYRYKKTSEDDTAWVTDTTTATSVSISGLDINTEYEFQVAATNSVGTGSYTASTTVSTSTTVPGVPTGATITNIDTDSFDVGWTAPADTGGEAITGYGIQWRQTGTTAWSSDTSTSTSITIDSLAANTEYEVQVRATNSNGNSNWTDSVEATTEATVTPPPPTPTGDSGAPISVKENGEWKDFVAVHVKERNNWIKIADRSFGQRVTDREFSIQTLTWKNMKIYDGILYLLHDNGIYSYTLEGVGTNLLNESSSNLIGLEVDNSYIYMMGWSYISPGPGTFSFRRTPRNNLDFPGETIASLTTNANPLIRDFIIEDPGSDLIVLAGSANSPPLLRGRSYTTLSTLNRDSLHLFDNNISTGGIHKEGEDIYVVFLSAALSIDVNGYVFRVPTDLSGVDTYMFALHSNNKDPKGIVFYEGYLYVLDNADNHIYCYRA